MDNFKESASKTIDIFEKYFKWHVIKILGGGSIESIESKQDKKSQEMDMIHGIDWIYTDINGKEWNFGSRIQLFGGPPESGHPPSGTPSYDTFTIRKKRETGAITEFAKRLKEKYQGILHYTFQGYFDLDRKQVLSYAIAKTSDILSMIENGYCGSHHTGYEQIGQADFFSVTWNGMKSENFRIIIIDGGQIDQIRDRRLEMLGI